MQLRMPGSQLCCLIGRNRTARKRFALRWFEAWPLWYVHDLKPRTDPIGAKRRAREQRKNNVT